MGTGMTDDFQAFLVAIGNDPELAVVLDLEAGINDLARYQRPPAIR
jgi:hypothetical protein